LDQKLLLILSKNFNRLHKTGYGLILFQYALKFRGVLTGRTVFRLLEPVALMHRNINTGLTRNLHSHANVAKQFEIATDCTNISEIYQTAMGGIPEIAAACIKKLLFTTWLKN
jgi:hypothetical protein